MAKTYLPGLRGSSDSPSGRPVFKPSAERQNAPRPEPTQRTGLQGWRQETPQPQNNSVNEYRPRTTNWSTGLAGRAATQDLKPYRAPSAAEAAALETAGWVVPKSNPGESVPEEWLDRTKTTKLKSHSYNISDQDWSGMQGLQLRGDYSAPAGPPGESPPKVRAEGIETVELTKEAYEALSDVQRDAVDFNTLLVNAREADLNKDYEPLDSTNTEDYNQRVRDIFGDKAGSNTLAPNTVGLLLDLGIQAKGADLDQFLSMERGVSLDELKDFSKPNGVVLGQLDEGIVAQAGAKIGQVLKMRGTNGEPAIGWGDPTTRTDKNLKQQEEFFQSMYGGLTDPTVTMDELNANLADADYTQEDMDSIWRYFDDYTRYEIDNGLDERRDGRSAAEIRTMLGLED